MQVKRAERSFIASARRSQIVDAAIETIAELGYGQASFARIAERADLSSTRLISYHFANKKELIEQVVAEIFSAIGEFMAERTGGERAPAAALELHIRVSVEFFATHRTQMRALTSIFLGGGLEIDDAEGSPAIGRLEWILGKGQESAAFRGFDVKVMASTIQRAIEGLPMLMATDPDLDLDLAADELVTTFRLATKKSGRS
jgi:AcrR family transcriptional regulator